MNAHCLSCIVLRWIANKRTALIIRVLAKGTRRYIELPHEIGRIALEIVTQALRRPERDGLVAESVVPLRIAYAVMPLERTLIEPLNAICHWSEKPLPQLKANSAGGNAADVRPKLRRT